MIDSVASFSARFWLLEANTLSTLASIRLREGDPDAIMIAEEALALHTNALGVTVLESALSVGQK